MIFSRAILACGLTLAAMPTFAAAWRVQTDKSRLSFTGVQTGAPFKGAFDNWSAEIAFDPTHPEAAHAKVTIDLASARTGDTQRDTALPQGDWFDVKKFPQATFEAAGFNAKGGDAYEAPGKLTIHGVSKDVVLPFTLTITGDSAAAKGHLTLTRTAFGIGQGPWTSGEWVALEVGVDVDLVATKAGG
ncbi:MAG: YceI family protein [Rhodospirillales bacterium]|nr:YceI family protein [Rhodospirillales bacterium]